MQNRTDRAASTTSLARAYLDDFTHASSRYGRNESLEPEIAALAAIGYALLALHEQRAAQPVRRRWWQRGAR
jgi:hypothetical protein